MAHVLHSIRSAYRRHGLANSCKLIAYNAFYYEKNALSFSAADAGELDEFDPVHGTETSLIRELGSLDTESDNEKCAVRYQPTDADIVPNLLGQVDVDLSSAIFTIRSERK